MTHKITLIPGDGIGPEVAAAARRVIDASGVSIEWEEVPARPDSYSSTDFSQWEAVKSVRRNGVGLKGPIATPIAEGPPSINVGLRKELELYANLRPAGRLEGLNPRWEHVDLVI